MNKVKSLQYHRKKISKIIMKATSVDACVCVFRLQRESLLVKNEALVSEFFFNKEFDDQRFQRYQLILHHIY